MTLKFNKKVILITSIASVVAGVTGFVLAYIFNFLINEKNKDPKKKSIQEFVLITGSNCYHFHHYMIAAVSNRSPSGWKQNSHFRFDNNHIIPHRRFARGLSL